MGNPHILHMITPLKHMSPFDVNMALDAGFDAVIPYTQVTLEEVRGLVQDAIFSRSPSDAARTGLFIAGKNASLALDMAEAAQEAMVGPFRLSVFADPAGSFTTAAAMVAVVEAELKKRNGRSLKGARIAIFGATGVVGTSSGVIAALEGADVTLVGYDGPTRVGRLADEIKIRFGAPARGADGSSAEKKRAIVAEADVVFCAAAAGVQVLSVADLAAAPNLIVAADVNAVPPPGIEGLAIDARGVPIGGSNAVGVGPLAIGDVKYKTESGLFKRMIASDTVLNLDFRDAFALAREIVG
jgi:methylene-tetrahydromethanopterin dehydrogenase